MKNRTSHKPKHKIISVKKSKPIQTPQNEREIALDFASQVHKKFDTIIKATILFGSQAKKEAKAGSDIDIIILIDDVSINWDLELVAWYREELAKLISSQKYPYELHINTVKLSTWWNDLMHGDPIVINVLRYGEALIDIGGFFNPQKALLLQGKVHSTPEAVYQALQRAPSHLARSKISELNSVEGVYWCMVDSAQAALMSLGKLPPSPEHITKMLKIYFVDNKLIPIEYIYWYRDIFTLHKNIVHGEVRQIKGIDIDLWQDKADKFMRKMAEVIDQIIESKKQ